MCYMLGKTLEKFKPTICPLNCTRLPQGTQNQAFQNCHQPYCCAAPTISLHLMPSVTSADTSHVLRQMFNCVKWYLGHLLCGSRSRRGATMPKICNDQKQHYTSQLCANGPIPFCATIFLTTTLNLSKRPRRCPLSHDWRFEAVLQYVRSVLISFLRPSPTRQWSLYTIHAPHRSDDPLYLAHLVLNLVGKGGKYHPWHKPTHPSRFAPDRHWRRLFSMHVLPPSNKIQTHALHRILRIHGEWIRVRPPWSENMWAHYTVREGR